MTDNEFEILDALYFTIPFKVLAKEVELEESLLQKELIALIQKSWVKCLEVDTEEEVGDVALINKDINRYNFLASKEGLMVHNSR